MHDPASVGEHDRRADRDAVEVGDRAVAVLATGKRQPWPRTTLRSVVAVAADRDRGEADVGVARRELLHRVERVGAAARASVKKPSTTGPRARACSC